MTHGAVCQRQTERSFFLYSSNGIKMLSARPATPIQSAKYGLPSVRPTQAAPNGANPPTMLRAWKPQYSNHLNDRNAIRTVAELSATTPARVTTSFVCP